MIERRPRQFFAVWADDGLTVKGAIFEESLFIDGAFWKNEQTPVQPEQFAEIGKLFAAGLQLSLLQTMQQITQLEKQVADLKKQILEQQV